VNTTTKCLLVTGVHVKVLFLHTTPHHTKTQANRANWGDREIDGRAVVCRNKAKSRERKAPSKRIFGMYDM